MIELAKPRERVICVGVAASGVRETMDSLDELEELCGTAGAEVLEKMIQSRAQADPGTYIGQGKIQELSERIRETGATGIVCDDELSPAQMKNLEDLLDIKVMDRTLVILDIFATRASSREGKIQVELAMLRYRSSRLAGLRDSLSRLGGGIGTRGPGESKLESDRRVIHQRIGVLKAELEEVKRHREVTRRQRKRNGKPVIAIVGYTNAGKSTLLNQMTGAEVLTENQLFATLDPTTRNLILPTGEEVLMTDTVGFIRKLPHHLIDAFRSTLEEAKYADVILHVVDAANPQREEQMEIVYQTLRDLEIRDKPVITAFNKADLIGPDVRLTDHRADDTLRISAKRGDGLEELAIVIGNTLRDRKVYIERLFPYSEGGRVHLIRRFGQLLDEEYRDDGIRIRAYVPREILGRLSEGENV